MTTTRKKMLRRLRREIAVRNKIIAVSIGSGLTAKYVIKGGADFLLALNSGIFRSMGRGSLCGFLPYTNSNEMVYNFAERELIPLIGDFPAIFGVNANDPTIDISQFLKKIAALGFTGVNNYPTIGLLDGTFRKGVEADGSSFDREIELIKKASDMGLATVAFVFDEEQTREMIEAGADIICVHLGLTRGGMLGAAKALSLAAAKDLMNRIFTICEDSKQNPIRMFYGGPVKTPSDVHYIYENTAAQGYIGGSAFDRIPTERSLFEITRNFKSTGIDKKDDLMSQMLDGIEKYYDYSGFVREYINQNYMHEISFIDLAGVCHISRSHLSALFHRDTGVSFPEYLVDFRISKAKHILENEHVSISQAAGMVGYTDAAQFSRIFKKYTGESPKTFQNRHKHKQSGHNTMYD
ncbi:MAG: AraC family transcriptional regulator [Candidatus Brocadia sp. WS118]|nr:MAG: AraC family transcriptional regulator [Candidatus Brocadia sp. WS118]